MKQVRFYSMTKKELCDKYGVEYNKFLGYKRRKASEFEKLNTADEQVKHYAYVVKHKNKTIKQLCEEIGVISYTNFLKFRDNNGLFAADESEIIEQIKEYIAFHQRGMRDGTFLEILNRDGVSQQKFYSWVTHNYGELYASNLVVYNEYKEICKACLKHNIKFESFNNVCGAESKYTKTMSLEEKIEFYKDTTEAKRIIEEAGINYTVFKRFASSLKESDKYTRVEMAIKYIDKRKLDDITRSYGRHFGYWCYMNRDRLAGLNKEEINKIYNSIELKIKYKVALSEKDRAEVLEILLKQACKSKSSDTLQESIADLCKNNGTKYESIVQFRYRHKEIFKGIDDSKVLYVYVRYIEILNRNK